MASLPHGQRKAEKVTDVTCRLPPKRRARGNERGINSEHRPVNGEHRQRIRRAPFLAVENMGHPVNRSAHHEPDQGLVRDRYKEARMWGEAFHNIAWT